MEGIRANDGGRGRAYVLVQPVMDDGDAHDPKRSMGTKTGVGWQDCSARLSDTNCVYRVYKMLTESLLREVCRFTAGKVPFP